MAKNGSTIGKAQKKAKKALLARYRQSVGNSRNGAKHSWPKVGRSLGFTGAYLYDVANGRRRASIKLLKALSIKPDAVMVIASPCKKCGQVHISKRCTQSKTFEDNCRAYDEWINRPKTQRQLRAMLDWAETPLEKRKKFDERLDPHDQRTKNNGTKTG